MRQVTTTLNPSSPTPATPHQILELIVAHENWTKDRCLFSKTLGIKKPVEESEV